MFANEPEWVDAVGFFLFILILLFLASQRDRG
jgi:hypothetical protein